MADKSPRRHPIVASLALLAGLAALLGAAALFWGTVISPGSVVLFEERIGVLPVEGIIRDSAEVVSELTRLRKDKSIKAVILRINSPGGAVAPAQEICAEIKRTSAQKPVVASLGAVAASGGYYIAAPSRMIIASPGTLTGSIGVVMQFVRVEDLLGKLGIQLEVLKAGEFKDMGSPHRRLTEKEREMIQELMEDVRTQFIREVSEGRRLSMEKVSAFADGRIFTGSKARELGLVDRMGGMEEAVAAAKELAGISGDVSLVYPKKTGLRLLDLLAARIIGSIRAALLREAGPEPSYLWSGLSAAPLTGSY